ncbi:LysR family transcriptional regulator [Noviherbaspirillum aridicola]|nr:LysR family transcriptional regulator [Noviherbaspirillum aridicola]
MDRLRSMEVFVAVANAGSFAAVSESLGMSAVMVGKHVRQLEQRLGISLISRTTRRQSLTEAGRAYAERCRLILAEIRAAESGAEALRSAPRGSLRISAPVSFGTQRLAPAITEYLAAYPEVGVDLNLSDRVVDLVEEGFDAAVRIGDLQDSTMVARPLMPYQMVMCASPEYLSKAGVPRRPADLARHQCLDFSPHGRRVHWNLKGIEGEFPASRFRSNNGQALRMAAIAGHGIAMQPEMLLREDIDAGRLVVLMPDYLPEPRPMSLIYRRDHQPTPKMQTFIAFMLERFGHQAQRTRPARAKRAR